MKTFKLFAVAAVTGVVLAGSFAAPALAWHPEVQITKYVQNITAGGEMADANDVESAVSTRPGDVIKYKMVITNTAATSSNGHNDLHFTEMTDNLPIGVALVSDASDRVINEDLGVLKPGQVITKEYTLKVTSTTDGDVIFNEACVTGDSEVHDAFRKDCDKAVVKVHVPPTPPEEPKKTPKVLPSTGPADMALSAGAATVLGYIGNLLRLKRRASKS
jgi:hypothetical protein